eukprot:GHUV01034619.1.p1 GENE.GHUV01034619.1~~GHUV01034619.1.p1  ORF type:complete len:222 (+),score=41.15 GHUV01034619.1:186-851(+)
MQNLRSRGQLHAGWGTPACRAPVSIPARIAVAARPPTRVHALPVGDVAHDLHAHIQTAFDLADAAAAAASSSSSSDGGFLAPVSNSLETVLKTIQEQLDRFHVPYSYGYSILILTAIVKLVTLPLTKKQVESSMAVQSLKPRIDMIKARYGDDQKKIKRETDFLYQQAGVNPLAGKQTVVDYAASAWHHSLSEHLSGVASAHAKGLSHVLSTEAAVSSRRG